MAASATEVLHIRGTVLPGGEERDLYIKNGRLSLKPHTTSTTLHTGGYILPGLVDMHAHLALASPAEDGASPGDTVRASARAQVDAGVLAVREPGSPNHDSKSLGPSEGLPRIVTGGRFLAAPGTYFPGLARHVTGDDLPAAAAEEARWSEGWAKVIGDWPDGRGGIRLTFDAATMKLAVDAVHAAGYRAAIHAMTTATVDAAIEAGFDSIEHGIGLQPEHLAVMAQRGTAFVPTLSIMDMAPGVLQSWGLNPAVLAPILQSVHQHPAMVRRAAESGVRVLAGTDAGMVEHGMIREEIRLLMAAGMEPTAALAAASWDGRAYLGLPGIEDGAPADLVVFAGDPRRDPAILARPSLRILDGVVLGGP